MSAAGHLLLAPFLDFAFMRRALVACLALALGAGPVGVLLVLRRMSLVGDAMSHAVLPGVAAGFLIAGLSLPAMSLGGFAVGLVVVLAAGFVTRTTLLREDASFAGFYVLSLATGVLVVSARGSSLDLMHLLFGSVLAVDEAGLVLIAAIATATLLTLAVIYRPLLIELFDPGFLKAAGGRGALYYTLFLVLIVLNLVAGFQALGTLMAVGLMILPAVAARFWAESVWSMAAASAGIALFAGYAGLLLSFHAGLPSGPCIVLVAGLAWLVSLFLGRRGSLRRRFLVRAHLEA
ncbi:MAG: metal ABC transporter permease [Rhodospirillaceae bacterium]|nr:metal ABC transporter permease [Rhodospirillaceae bacterium]